MRPRLEAEESMLAVDRLAVGGGRVSNVSAVLDRWMAIAQPALTKERNLMARQSAQNGVPKDLSDMGIGVHVVQK
jgi:hypothetical protein